VTDEVSARDLRNHTREVLRRIERGESLQITLNRRPIAELRPPARPFWIPGSKMAEVLRAAPADAGLLEDLAPLREPVVERP
jgi:antitoxin (DNA-binding transcriptional repressor) of toxin-antitoxin stability system